MKFLKCCSPCHLKPVPWILAEFRHNRIVQSLYENDFDICRQHKVKSGLVKIARPFILATNNLIFTSYRKFLFNFITSVKS